MQEILKYDHSTTKQENPMLAALVVACCAALHRYVERQRKIARLGENQYF